MITNETDHSMKKVKVPPIANFNKKIKNLELQEYINKDNQLQQHWKYKNIQKDLIHYYYNKQIKVKCTNNDITFFVKLNNKWQQYGERVAYNGLENIDKYISNEIYDIKQVIQTYNKKYRINKKQNIWAQYAEIIKQHKIKPYYKDKKYLAYKKLFNNQINVRKQYRKWEKKWNNLKNLENTKKSKNNKIF